jgi:hypothetical protein
MQDLARQGVGVREPLGLPVDDLAELKGTLSRTLQSQKQP